MTADTPCLAAQHLIGIDSILNNTDQELWLWSYQHPYENGPVHKRVVLKDLELLMPRAMFEARLNAGVRIQHLADYLRLCALAKHGGVYVDADAMVLRPLRVPVGDELMFATQLNKRSGWPGAGARERRLAPWAGAPYMAGLEANQGGDGRAQFINSPIGAAAPGHWFIVQERNAALRIIRREKQPQDYRKMMNQLREAVVDAGLQRFVHPPFRFCPLPYVAPVHVLRYVV